MRKLKLHKKGNGAIAFLHIFYKNPGDKLVSATHIHVELIKKVHILRCRLLNRDGQFRNFKKQLVIETKKTLYFTSYTYLKEIREVFGRNISYLTGALKRVVDHTNSGREYSYYDKTLIVDFKAHILDHKDKSPTLMRLFLKREKLKKVRKAKKKKAYDHKRWKALQAKKKLIKTRKKKD